LNVEAANYYHANGGSYWLQSGSMAQFRMMDIAYQDAVHAAQISGTSNGPTIILAAAMMNGAIGQCPKLLARPMSAKSLLGLMAMGWNNASGQLFHQL
jgi:hypothetical protein